MPSTRWVPCRWIKDPSNSSFDESSHKSWTQWGSVPCVSVKNPAVRSSTKEDIAWRKFNVLKCLLHNFLDVWSFLFPLLMKCAQEGNFLDVDRTLFLNQLHFLLPIDSSAFPPERPPSPYKAMAPECIEGSEPIRSEGCCLRRRSLSHRQASLEQ